MSHFGERQKQQGAAQLLTMHMFVKLETTRNSCAFYVMMCNVNKSVNVDINGVNEPHTTQDASGCGRERFCIDAQVPVYNQKMLIFPASVEQNKVAHVITRHSTFLKHERKRSRSSSASGSTQLQCYANITVVFWGILVEEPRAKQSVMKKYLKADIWTRFNVTGDHEPDGKNTVSKICLLKMYYCAITNNMENQVSHFGP